jgi:hypothetical protein
MADRAVNVITTDVEDARLVRGVDSLGVATELAMRDSPVATAFVTNRMGDSISETVPAASFVARSATVATYDMAQMIPEGAIILGVFVVTGAGFAEDTSATLKVGDRHHTTRYHTTAFDVFTTDATGVGGDAPVVSQRQSSGGFPTTLTLTSAADIDSVIAGAGEATVTIFFQQTWNYWCLEHAGQYKNHPLYIPKATGTCTAGSKVVKLENWEAEQIAVWIDFYFEVQYWLHDLVATDPLTAASTYIFDTQAFDYEPYSFTTLINVVADAYAGGWSLAIPHYTMSLDDFHWYEASTFAMDYAQTLIRSKIVT